MYNVCCCRFFILVLHNAHQTRLPALLVCLSALSLCVLGSSHHPHVWCLSGLSGSLSQPHSPTAASSSPSPGSGSCMWFLFDCGFCCFHLYFIHNWLRVCATYLLNSVEFMCPSVAFCRLSCFHFAMVIIHCPFHSSCFISASYLCCLGWCR